MPEIKGGVGVSLRADGANLFIDGYAPTDSTTTVYVSGNGSDANSGLTRDKAKKTITAAMTAAAGVLSGAATKAEVLVMGADAYTESFTVPADVILLAQAATVVGSITVSAGARVILYAHYASENNQTMMLKTGAGGGWYSVFISDGRGTAGTLTGTVNANNDTTNSIFFLDAALMYVADTGVGIRESADGFGHIHFNVKDLYLAGNDAQGIRFQGGASDGIGYVDHILETPPGGFTGTKAIHIGATSEGKIIACEVKAETAWEILTAGPNTGDLYLLCPKVLGTKTGELSNT